MRNAGIAFLSALLCALLCFVACADDDRVVVEGDDVVYAGMQPVDSLSFRTLHHYWKGYRFHTTDTLGILSSVPTYRWTPDTLQVERGREFVVADIVCVPTDTPDSIWLKMVLVSDTLLLQGWTSEADLLAVSRPTHFVARLLSFLGPLADVPGGDYPDAWLDFYFHPTANPFLLPWPMACVVIGLWALFIALLALLDKYLIEPYRYRCGRCGAPLRKLGKCPCCGAVNERETTTDPTTSSTHSPIPSLSPSKLPSELCHPSPVREGADTLANEESISCNVISPSLTGEGWQGAVGSPDGERLGVRCDGAVGSPDGERLGEILLHCCCAPCSSAILEWMLANGVRPVLYYCNPNIYPQEEYLIRKNELMRHAQRLGLRVIDDDYDHEAWLAAVRGLENEPERGSRCLQCFKYRLLRTARVTQQLGLREFTTTLASSRWKSLDQINEAGAWAAAEVNASLPEGAAPVAFNARNWRKGGLQERRNQLLREYGFYNQQYCGCEFSIRNTDTL